MEARWPPKGILERGGKRSSAPSSPAAGNLRLFPAAPEPKVTFQTDLGQFVVGDCLGVLRGLEAESVDLVVTSPPYDGQPKYGNGEKYERDWYAGFFLDVAVEVHRILKPHGSLVQNRSIRRVTELDSLVGEIDSAADWNTRVALIRKVPEIFGLAAHSAVYARIAKKIYVPNLAPEAHTG